MIPSFYSFILSKKFIWVFIFGIIFITNCYSATFEFSPIVQKAYKSTLCLRFEEAKGYLNQARQQEPQNVATEFVADYMDFLTIFINEEYDEFKRLEVNKAKRLNLMKGIDKNSPYFLYTQAEIQLHWALARIKFEQYVKAYSEVTDAYTLLTENTKKFPDFVANKKSLGIMHAGVGTIPDSYKWVVKFSSGMEGSIAQGQKEVEEVIHYAQNNYFAFEEETYVIYTLLLLHLKNQDDTAWKVIKTKRWNPQENPLAAFGLASVAMKTGKNDEAIQLLQAAPQGGAYKNFYYINYMLGLAKLYKGDKDASNYLYKYVKNFKGKHYIKETYQKLAWFYLINGDTNAYWTNIKLCKSYGSALQEGDKNALREAEQGLIPNATLLKARLMFDGGYYKNAYQLLKSNANYSETRFVLEYFYRLGRIAHKLNYNTEAIENYQKTINQGANQPYYYACNAALQLGMLYEEQKQKQKAIEYYQKCLNINPSEYRDGLHQKAKAGLKRLK